MSTLKSTTTALLRGLAYVSQRISEYEAQPSHDPAERYQYVRLCRVRRALRHDAYQIAADLPFPASGVLLMHINSALVGDLHGEYALQERERGSSADPSTWQVERWVAPSGEGS